MSVQFWPCPGCSRHVKRGEPICPFCGATASAEIGPTRALAGRLSRAALFAAGAMGATSITATACSVSAYGGSPVPIETEDASANDGPTDAAPDAGDASATTVPTDSSPTADVPMAFGILYGAAVIPDE